jgi:hypothetical protein
MPGLPPGVELSVWMLLKTQAFNHISAKNGYRLAILFSYNLHPFLAGLLSRRASDRSATARPARHWFGSCTLRSALASTAK